MTIRSNTDLGRRAETHLATITGTSNSILFHAGHRKLGMSNRNRDNLLVGEPPKRVQEIIADNLSKACWSWGAVSQLSTPQKAWRVASISHAKTRFLAVAGLFYVRQKWARYAGRNPLVIGSAMIAVGLGLVGVTILLGG
jgi:hypothetical protein